MQVLMQPDRIDPNEKNVTKFKLTSRCKRCGEIFTRIIGAKKENNRPYFDRYSSANKHSFYCGYYPFEEKYGAPLHVCKDIIGTNKYARIYCENISLEEIDEE